MKRLWSVVLILAALLAAGCQTSQREETSAQTQAAQAAFDQALAAAQKQASATDVYIQPTAGPAIPTMQPGAADMYSYLTFSARNFRPVPELAATTVVESAGYVLDGNGAPTHLEVLITKADTVHQESIYAMVFTAFEQIYADPALTASVQVPQTLNTFRVSVQDGARNKISSLAGSWSDVMALGKGQLTFQEFLGRLIAE